MYRTWKFHRLVSTLLLCGMLAASLPGTASAAPQNASCTNNAAFVSDITVPDNTKIEAGKPFEKVWRIKNTGTCTWTTSYVVGFVSGERMGSPASVRLPKSVAPGASVDIKVNMTAPSTSGTQRGVWRLKTSSGTEFGHNFWVQIITTGGTGGSTGTTSGWEWTGQYFKNAELRGVPSLTRTDKAIDFNWGSGAPATGFPGDYFSIRWKARPNFDGGTYRFRIKADTGARLYVDGKLVLDAWRYANHTLWTVDVDLSKGRHDIRLDYREVTGDASVRLSWEKVSKVNFSQWKAEYFPNTRLARSPALVRNDKNIDFNWGTGAAASGLPADNFTARWTRTINFTPGTYRFTARADDGIRVYVDGVLLIDKWATSYSTTHTADLALTGNHQIVVTYLEKSGSARVKFGWERLADIPSPTPTASPTTTAVPPTATPEATATPTPEPTATEPGSGEQETSP